MRSDTSTEGPEPEPPVDEVRQAPIEHPVDPGYLLYI